MVDTHAYDGKLHDIIKLIQNDLNRVHKISKDKKIERFKVLRKELETYSADKSDSNKLAFKYFDIICESIGHPSNYDPTNKLHACDLLYLCCELLTFLKSQTEEKEEAPPKEKEGDGGGDTPPDTLMEILLMQLNDMHTGSCPQGRTTRLFQVYFTKIKGI